MTPGRGSPLAPAEATRMTTPAPLGSVRIVECSMLGPGRHHHHLADLGADVIKVEPPSGDYIRQMTWPIVEGISLMHLHISRGKRSIVLDLRTDEGRAVFLELVRGRRRRDRGHAPGRARASAGSATRPAGRSTRASCSARSPATA